MSGNALPVRLGTYSMTQVRQPAQRDKRSNYFSTALVSQLWKLMDAGFHYTTESYPLAKHIRIMLNYWIQFDLLEMRALIRERLNEPTSLPDLRC